MQNRNPFRQIHFRHILPTRFHCRHILRSLAQVSICR
jgi:hypothetical protein